LASIRTTTRRFIRCLGGLVKVTGLGMPGNLDHAKRTRTIDKVIAY
jgi:hypothetical protein